MNDEQDLLASAYLDGALTSEERARAEADPEVMAAAERLGELRRALGVIEPADPARREAAIQAALDAFDTARAPGAPVTPLAPRRWGGWLVPAAAAALVVVFVGGVIAMSRDGNGDGDDAGEAAQATLEVLLTGPADTGAETRADTGGTEAPQTDPAAEEAGGAATTAPEATTGPTSGAASDESVTATSSALLLTSPDELTRFAGDALRAGQPNADMSPPNCDEGRWLGPATYVVDGVATPVEVFWAEADGEIRAVDASTCEVVARAPAP